MFCLIIVIIYSLWFIVFPCKLVGRIKDNDKRERSSLNGTNQNNCEHNLSIVPTILFAFQNYISTYVEETTSLKSFDPILCEE